MKSKILILYFLILSLTGCATQSIAPAPPAMPPSAGIYHRVLPGETLWRISQAYNVDLDTLVSMNRIPNAARIEKGQMIFIPGAASLKTTEIEKNLPTESNFIWPVKGKIIAYFGERFRDKLNHGLNIQLKGNSEVRASRSGRVSFADSLKGYAKTVIIDHGDGISTVYANNSELLVRLMDSVNQGTPIAKCETGKQGGSYFHFEIRKGSKPQNPLYYLP